MRSADPEGGYAFDCRLVARCPTVAIGFTCIYVCKNLWVQRLIDLTDRILPSLTLVHEAVSAAPLLLTRTNWNLVSLMIET